MSASNQVIGFKPPDEKWKRMKKAWDACSEAGIDPPPEVEKFFNGEEPDDAGVEVDIKKLPCCKKYSEDMMDGFEIDLTKLPKDVTVIRCYVSY